MAIRLQDKPRVTPPTSDFPYGEIKDTTPGNPGTPVNTNVYGDFHQFFAKIADVAGIIFNGILDNAYSGFQYFQALLRVGFKYHSSPIILGLLDGNYTTNDLIVLSGVAITLSNSNNTATWTSGSIYYNGNTYLVDAGTLTKSSGVFLYVISDPFEFSVTISSGTSGTGIADYGGSNIHYYGVKIPLTPINGFTNLNGNLAYIKRGGRVSLTGGPAEAPGGQFVFASLPTDARPLGFSKGGVTICTGGGATPRVVYWNVDTTGDVFILNIDGTILTAGDPFYCEQISFEI